MLAERIPSASCWRVPFPTNLKTSRLIFTCIARYLCTGFPIPRRSAVANTTKQLTMPFMCDCVQSPVASDDYSKYAIQNSSTDSMSSGSEILNTDYRKVTPLFRAIEKENWEGILLFLTTGKWNNSMLTSTHHHLTSPSAEIQAKTWVTAYDRNGEPEWSQLPLHAAISYSAPFVVVQQLVKLYPKGVQCTDNEGMLPIHLAFGFGAQDNVLALLLETFPSSVNEIGLGGRFPYECCELGPNKVRGRVYKIVTDETVRRVKNEIDVEWKRFVSSANQSLGMETEDIEDKKLTEYLLELMKDRKELLELKKKAASKPPPKTIEIESTNQHPKSPLQKSKHEPKVASPKLGLVGKGRGRMKNKSNNH